MRKWYFSPHGIAHFTTQYQGPDRQFQSTPFKKSYRDVSQDSGAWHFWGDPPLQAVDGLGIPLISARWLEIQEACFRLEGLS